MISFHKVTKQYNGQPAIAEVSLEIPDSEFVFVVGPSGAGKSTILKLIIREELPSRGKVFVDEWDIANLSDQLIPHLRRKVGTVFQDFKLLPQRTVYENIAFPLEIVGLGDAEIDSNVREVLELINLAGKADHFPQQLSGGEAQKVAIARAMILRPEILLADEPTGNLDPQSAWEIMQLLAKLNDLGTTVIMATHNMDISSSLPHRKIHLMEGRLVKDTKDKKGKKEEN
ncbi:MAG: cell division ATP-binding protein FtsE [Candidatus Woykebacteria bacterium RIFCSPHIGHO2_01_FULL_39_12]|uniref:Cell division ATP-binding protein FtsE n=2 Tax=Candidatus Woykeibacteriota TaxID=1817899 RepID=A0A1G1WBW2_9BACT|nr:MAG: cell division ATP-binding protein FtsE [Candidatus Woykebacteria bacterium RBG_16_39_9b]OGY27320.1 MAG: cell division ATP-binding protein FtsE [Candidatus Woykebacteria bacterium RIFCSPHIGHO2_01_FULL_39_12]